LVTSGGKKTWSSLDCEKKGLSRLPDEVRDRVEIELPDEDLVGKSPKVFEFYFHFLKLIRNKYFSTSNNLNYLSKN
jgi:hypothetical protein